MVSCFKKLLSLSLLVLAVSCGQDGAAPDLLSGGSGPITGKVSLYAGSPNASANTDGDRLTARFNGVNAMTTDGTNLYISDFGRGIRKINLASGIVSTVATGFDENVGIVYLKGYIYLWDAGPTATNIRIFKVNASSGAKSVIANNKVAMEMVTDGTSIFYIGGGDALSKLNPSDNSTSTHASGFGSTKSIAYGGGFLWVSTGSSIEKVDVSTGAKTRVVGDPNDPNDTDGTGATARIGRASALAYRNGQLFFFDADYHVLKVWDIATDMVTTIAGQSGVNGYADGTGTQATFSTNGGGLVSVGKFLYLGDGDNEIVRKIQ